MARKSNQVTRPSGLRQSPDGNYIYANCVVSGKPTFFKPDYFKSVLARFGGDEVRMFKEYVCKDVSDLRKTGKTDEQIKEMLARGEKAEKVVAEVKVEKVKEPTVKAEKVEEKIVYPWQVNPNHFGTGKITPSPIDYAEATKDSCFYPNRYLDDQCEGCPLLDKCQCHLKVDDAARAKLAERGRAKNKVKQMVFVSDAQAKELAEQADQA